MKRYHVCKFPSRFGTPWKFRSKLVALCAARVRGKFGFSISEIRVIDTVSLEHIYVS